MIAKKGLLGTGIIFYREEGQRKNKGPDSTAQPREKQLDKEGPYR
jgi:hypothetical protein